MTQVFTTRTQGATADPDALLCARTLERTRLRALMRLRLFGVPSPPLCVGRFEIRRKLGEGASGVVYAAFDPRMAREVALKLLVAKARDRSALLREARTLAQIKHPNVLTAYEVGAEGDLAYIVSELVTGGTLRDWMAEPHTQAERVEMLRGIGAGVVEAHAAGLVHRDLKPENILVGQGRPRVADFGLAQVFPGRATAAPLSELEESETAVGAVVGTPAYMAPEQREGAAPAPANDQYSLALIAYELLFERHALLEPVSNSDEGERAYPELLSQPRPPTRGHPARAAWPALRRALAASETERWPSVAEFQQGLQHALLRPRRRWRAVVAGGTLLLALAALLRLALVAPEPHLASASALGEPVEVSGDAAWLAIFQHVQPLVQTQDYVGCATYLREHTTTPQGRALWVSCAEMSALPALLEESCAAARADPAPPDICEPLLVTARAHFHAGRMRECTDLLLASEASYPRIVQVNRCAATLRDRELGQAICVYTKRFEHHPDPEGYCRP